ncbi:MAG TPA: GNAT family N-acetyltransferase [Pseudonocardiaceae bacterium]|jgi:RimJ/RimL family protein N-acetyltransferase
MTHALRFVTLSASALAALVAKDLAAACAEARIELPEYFVSEDALWLWRLRHDQVVAEPASGEWVARAVVAEPDDIVVGYAGYHGPPDDNGMVEIGYTVLPEHRRQGYARAILRALIERAVAEPEVRVVRVTISPDNIASLATIAGIGFVYVGEQWDDEDGRELIFELPAD